MAKVEKKCLENAGLLDYTEDGTTDLKGRPITRSKTGRWRACSFLVGYEIFERMANHGISANLVVYLARKLHEGTVKSSNNVTNWTGTLSLTPILGAYVADTYLGRYWTFVSASAIYIMGMSLLTLAVSVPALRPPSCGPGIKDEDCTLRASPFQVGIFYCALYMIAVGIGGTKPNISTMGADQFDSFEPKEKHQKLSFFNWWMFCIAFGNFFSYTFLVYIQDNVGWSLGYGLPTIGLVISVLVFLVGTPFYRHKMPSGSPITRVAQVLAAAVRKWKVNIPNDPRELHDQPSLDEHADKMKHRIDHTSSLRFLDRAAVKSTRPSTPWTLCPVTQVEETKQMMKMIPVLLTTFIPSIIIAQTHTLFIKQGTTLDASMGPHFKIPPASFGAFVTIFVLVTLAIYDRYLVPTLRSYTQNPRGITMLKRMGIGYVVQIVIMVLACLVEKKRLLVARENGIVGKGEKVPLTIFILLPQFALMGVADAFLEVAKIEFFYDQAPQGMKSIGTSYYTSSYAVGSFLSSFLLKTVSDMTKRDGHKGWVLDNLNLSHLDYYYALLAGFVFLNFLLFLVVAKSFAYNVDISEAKIAVEA
ncbi:protein NRT1/ PTR FAMILY 5.2-like [Rosa rugosa]|uniref:protein NRT1/ PTR FAMILY 5.2-like n=1 Tax=Rosa rugosa TaxID=74645 RepID=UPI002B4049AB|nr:protein NRT1/ PTR FAMILY 5.2-like [Rosa rugosa]